jgi:Fe2+ transport system protein B
MLEKLISKLTQQNMTIVDLANLINLTPQELNEKIKENKPLLSKEAEAIINVLNLNYSEARYIFFNNLCA